MNDREFWIAVRRGLLTVVSAIEYRWNLPRGSTFTIGATPPVEAQEEQPVAVAARESHG